MNEQATDNTLLRQKQQLRAHLRALVAQESDRLADSARDLASRLADIPRNKLDLTQVRNIESLAVGTDKVSDISDLLKKLIGRDGRGERWARGGVGQSLLNELEGLRDRADQIAEYLKQYASAYDKDLPRRIHLQLCREYLHHVTANFEYLRREKEQTYREGR